MCNSTGTCSIMTATRYTWHMYICMYTHPPRYTYMYMYHVPCTTTQHARSRWLCALCTQIQTIAVPLNGNSLIKTNYGEFGLQHESSSVVTQVCSCTCQQWIYSTVLPQKVCAWVVTIHVCQYTCTDTSDNTCSPKCVYFGSNIYWCNETIVELAKTSSGTL